MQRNVELEATIVAKYAAVSPVLDERSRRRWAAAESVAIGYGGDALVSSATGLARETLRKGRREITQGGTLVEGFVGGRPLTGTDGVFALDGLMPDTPIALQAELGSRRSPVETISVGPGMMRLDIVLTLP